MAGARPPSCPCWTGGCAEVSVGLLANWSRTFSTRRARIGPGRALSTNDHQKSLIEALGEEEFKRLVGDFAASCEQMLATAERALSQRDAEAFDREMHTLKGAALTLGFVSLADLTQAERTKDFASVRLDTIREHSAIAA